MKAKSRRKGVAYIWAALVAPVVIAFVGLSIDGAYGYLVAHQLHNAADAASLAGAQLVREDPLAARQAAIAMALKNLAAGDPVRLAGNPANAFDGDVVIGLYDREARQFTATLANPNAVKVVARRTENSLGGRVGLLFAPIFGVLDVGIQRSAVAMIGGGTGAGLICLNEEDKWTFRLSGTITLDVRDVTTDPPTGGAIQVNSDDERALKTDGGPTLLAEEINVVALEVNDPPEFDGDVNTKQPLIPDPLAGLEPPTNWGTDRGDFSVTGGTHALGPGYYPEGISMTGGTVNLAPGIYVLDGAGLNVTGGNLIAHEVMFYIVDTTPANNKPSRVKLTGNGIVDITPIPLEVEPYGGIAFWQARNNPSQADIRGTDQFTGIDGTLYFPDARVDITGTSDSFGIAQLICDSIEISGVGTLTINYDGRFPAPGTSIFLVE